MDMAPLAKGVGRRIFAAVAILCATACAPAGRENAKSTPNEAETWNRKLKCSEIGLVRERELDSEAAATSRQNPRMAYSYLQSERCFSVAMNTCIREQEFMHSLGSDAAMKPLEKQYTHATVYDDLTGAILADAYIPMNSETKSADADEYRRKRNLFFAECAK